MRITISSLLPETRYAIELRATNDSEKSEWGPRFEFITAGDTDEPAVPENITWEVDGSSFFAQWDSVTKTVTGRYSAVTRYEVELRERITRRVVSVPQQTANRVGYLLTLEENRRFFVNPANALYMRVRAVDNKELKSEWSEEYFVSADAPGKVTNLTAQGVTDGIEVKWEAPFTGDDGQLTYKVFVGTDPAFIVEPEKYVYHGDAKYFVYSTGTYSEHTIHVAAVNGLGVMGDTVSVTASPVSPYGVDIEPPEIPTGLSASIDVATKKITASWMYPNDEDDDLHMFVVRWRVVGDEVWAMQWVPKEDLTATWEVSNPFAPFEIQVGSLDKFANYSDWSEMVAVSGGDSIPPPVVTGLVASPGLDSLSLTWDESTAADVAAGAGGYQIEVSTSNTFANVVVSTITAATAISFAGLERNTTYYSRVRAIDASKLTGEWSETVSAKTIDFPVPALSDGNVPTSAPTPATKGGVNHINVNWSHITNADPVTYELYVGTTAGFTPSASNKVAETPGTFAIVVSANAAGAPLVSGTNYFFKIRTKDYDGLGPVGNPSNATQIVKIGPGDSNLTPEDIGAPSIDDFEGLSDQVGLSIKNYVTEYAVNSSEVTAPTTGWQTTSPTRTPGSFIWTRTRVTYHDNSTSTTNPALLTGNTGTPGTPAPLVTLTTPTQVLSQSAGSTATTPTTTTVSASALNTTINSWSYSVNGGTSWLTTPPAGVSTPDNNSVTITGSTMTARTITVRAGNSTVGIYDTLTIAKVSDGAHGTDGTDGVDGRGIQSTTINYAKSTNGTSAPATGWATTIPTTTHGEYLWTRTVTTYTKGTPASDTAYSVAAHGAPGTPGAAGRGIQSTVINYAKSTNGSTAPSTGWSSTLVATAPGEYLWTRTVTTYTHGTPASDTAYSVAYHGTSGTNGADAYTIVLTNESAVFAGSTTAALTGNTTTNILAYKGAVQVPATVKSISARPTGMTATAVGSGTTNARIDIAVGPTLTALNGELTFVITVDGTDFIKNFSWAVSRRGVDGEDGSDGTDGAPAPVVTVTSTTQALIVPPTPGATNPATAVVSGTSLNTTISTVEFSVNGSTTWVTANPAGVTGTGSTRTITGSTMTARTIAVRMKDANGVSDTITIAKVADGYVGRDGVDGADGRGIESTSINYAKSSNGTTAPTSGWTTTIPATSPGEFLWTRTTTNYTTGSPDNSYSVSAHGVTGAPGAGITSTAVTYQVSNNGTTPPGSWLTTIPATSPGQFLWTRTVTNYSGGIASTEVFSVSAHGVTGAPGTNGRGVSGTTVNYAKNTSPTANPTTGWAATPPATSAGEYLWTRTITNYTDGTSNSASPAYSVAAHGTPGTNGTNGADAYTVIVSNEAMIFPGSTTAALAGTETTSLMAFKGTTQMPITISNFQGNITGQVVASVNAGTNGTNSPVITVQVYPALTATTGTITFTAAVDGRNILKTISWSVTRQGANGAPGTPGTPGRSIRKVDPYFLRQAATANPPAKPTASTPTGWSLTEPTYVIDTKLYRTERIEFTDNSFEYSAVTEVSAYSAASLAMETANSNSKILYGASSPTASTPGRPGYIFWVRSGDKITEQWLNTGGSGTTSGNTWVRQELASETIAELNAGKLVSGIINTAELTLASSGVIQSNNYDTAANGFRLSATGMTLKGAPLTIANVGGLGTSLDSKETPSGAQAKATAAQSAAVSTAGTNTDAKINTYNTNTVQPALNSKLSETDPAYVAQKNAFNDWTGTNPTGSTVIHGGALRTDTVDAVKIKANTAFTQDLFVKSTFTLGDASTPGVIRSFDYNSTTKKGFSLSSSGLEIWEGKVNAAALETGTVAASVITLGAGGIIRSELYGTSGGTSGFALTDAGLIIKSGEVSASILTAGTIQGATTINLDGTMNVANSGWIQSAGYTVSGSAGFRLSSTGLDVKSGTIAAGAISSGTYSGKTFTVGASGSIVVDSTGVIRSNNYSPAWSGWQLSSNGLEIIGGTIRAATFIGGGFFGTTYEVSSGGYVRSGDFNTSLQRGWSLDPTAFTMYNGTIRGANIVTNQLSSTNGLFNINSAGYAELYGARIYSNTTLGSGSSNFIQSNFYSPRTSGWQIRGDGQADFGKATINSGLFKTAGTSTRVEIGDTGNNDWVDEVRMFSGQTVASIRNPSFSPGDAYVSLNGGLGLLIGSRPDGHMILSRGQLSNSGGVIKFLNPGGTQTGIAVQIRTSGDGGLSSLACYNIHANNVTPPPSYLKFKEDVNRVPREDYSRILKLNGAHTWKYKESPDYNSADAERAGTEGLGLIADYLPEYVKTETSYSLNGVVYFLWDALREAYERIERLENDRK